MTTTTITIGWTRSDMAIGYSSFDGYREGASQHTETIEVDVPDRYGNERIADSVFTASNAPGLTPRDGFAYQIQQAIAATGYDGRGAHFSLSVGDTVTVNGVSLACQSAGWVEVTIPPPPPPAPTPATYVSYYVSQDLPGGDAPWSVYSERYHYGDDDNPIDNSGELLSTWDTENEADAEAHRLHVVATTAPIDNPDALARWLDA